MAVAEDQLMLNDESRENKGNYRGIPDLAFLSAVVRRNSFVSLLILALYSPLALIFVARQSNEYTSGVMLKYDGSDALDIDAPPQASFPASVLAIASPMTGSDFFVELSKVYNPPSEESNLSRIPALSRAIKFIIGEEAFTKKFSSQRLGAHALAKSVSLSSEFEQRVANVGLLTAVESSPDRARMLALTAANLIIERYYSLQTSRLEAVTKNLSIVLDKDQVKEMVERAISNSLQDDRNKAGRAVQEAAVALRARQQTVQDRIKELNLRLQEDRERRLKIEGEISTLAQRYGPYHPQIKALQSQLKEINQNNQYKQMSVELSKLQDQNLNYEAEATALGMGSADAPLEAVDRVVQRLTTKLDRYNLELLSLKQQNLDPSHRVRLHMIGSPSLPLQPSKSVVTKSAIIAAAFGIALVLAAILLREFFYSKASETWRISWIAQLPCLARLSAKTTRTFGKLDSETIRDVRSQLFDQSKNSRRTRALAEYRQLTHSLHTKTIGPVVFIAKTAERFERGNVLNNIVNIYACDYPGRYLVVDLDGANSLETKSGGEPTVIDFLARKSSWKEVCIPRNGQRMFDVVLGPPPIDRRTSEIIASSAFGDMIKSALKIYKKIFIIGFGPDHFVENTGILSHASDCVLLTESYATTVKNLKKQVDYFDREKIIGYFHVAG